MKLEPVNRYELEYNNTVDEIIQMIHKIMKALKEIHYNGYITVECDMNAGVEIAASDAINYLKPLL